MSDLIQGEVQVADYGTGNLGSVVNMIKHVGGRASICSEPEALADCRKVILPSVGHFGRVMGSLRDQVLVFFREGDLKFIPKK